MRIRHTPGTSIPTRTGTDSPVPSPDNDLRSEVRGSDAESGAAGIDLSPDVLELARRLAAMTPEHRAALAALLAPAPAPQPARHER